MTITVRIHHPKDDPKCLYDYTSIDIIANKRGISGKGVHLKTYGDSYHEKGRERVEGFLDALRIFEDIGTVTYEHVADAEI